ncbi:hypothetical protein vBYenM06162_013 [Yersinia phage vB_YenM_06.16-2]|uniref:Uncharacterized protein n=1 Tax=Yersinia phage vB_YenM_06.16-2 TaxID=2918920 RepID=A0AAE9JYI1_9CAUD|nr:hypothetical protein PQA68_gp13 [Yersinia phage vB_YenM_06.16-2]UNA05857.1 hypothetical protein vBYenM06162_013 [Yersinia phage vB_YenM_06.16-2]
MMNLSQKLPLSPSPGAVLDTSCKCMKSDLQSAQAWRARKGF